jgi:hypothetical protein
MPRPYPSAGLTVATSRWLLLAALAGLAACGGGGGTVGSGAACAAAVRLHGEWLLAATVDDQVRRRLPPLRGTVRAAQPPCNDTNGAHRSEGTVRRLRRLAGVSPAIALAETDGRRIEALYLGQDYLAVLAAHPLHRALYGSDGRPVATRGRCRPAAALTGRIGATALGDDAIAVGGRSWAVDARTTADVPAVGGMPRLAHGIRVRVAGVRCRGGWVARRISTA